MTRIIFTRNVSQYSVTSHFSVDGDDKTFSRSSDVIYSEVISPSHSNHLLLNLNHW